MNLRLLLSKLYTIFKVNNKEYNLNDFLSVEPYVKKLILEMNRIEIKYDTKSLQNETKINTTLVKQIKDNELIQLPKLRDGIVIDSIVIEGNDISGKETYSRFLYNDIYKEIRLTPIHDHHNVELLSFPTYTSKIGVIIKKLLRKQHKTNFDMYLLNWLFCYDRVNVMFNIYENFNSRSLFKNYHHILIFDRFYQSNWVYNSIGDDDSVVDWLFRTESVFFDSINIRDIILFLRDKNEPDEVHDKLINNKSGKDLNETVYIQQLIRDKFLSSKFKKKISNQYFAKNPNIHYFTVKDVVVDDLPRNEEFLDKLYHSIHLYKDFK